MFTDVLVYTWERNQLLNSLAELWPDEQQEFLVDEPLKRDDGLSRRIIDLVAQDDFDKIRAI